ncbi:MAG: hypothetical protein KKB90_11545 [Actinobacteria bacterium]|nr:hypothetical protein [Actinomycetota bacterium]MCG2818255.1 hypothetical protein [Actinomycetes bacterium]MBU4219579.1 hypothetical protein [Actinomycetota bacterium]MBU4358792.1 hypothetical protein [Actinomycetota bacterium]MBU4391433.1 hypothetical protein [Actinomycetota bacterium]
MKIKKPVLITIMLSIALGLSGIHCPPCFAQEFDIKLWPSINELTIEPGTTQALDINLLNKSTNDLRLRVYEMDYTVTPDNKTSFEEPGHYSFSCARWITTEIKEFELPAGREETIPFSVAVPPDAEPGTHNAIIFFEVILQPEVEGETVVRSTGRVGALVLVTIPGLIVREGEIESVSVQSEWFWPSKKIPVIGGSSPGYRVVVNNTGNVHLTTKGVLYYTPSFGWGMGSIQLPEMVILPHTKRYYEGTLPDPPFLGSYDVTVEVMYGPNMYEFDTSKTGSAAFNVYPAFLLLALIILISLPVVAVKLVRFFIRKKKAPEVEAGEKEERGEKEPRLEELWAELLEDEKEEIPGDEDSGDGGEQDDIDDEGQKEPGEKEKLRERGSGKLNLRRLFKRGRKK